MELTKKEKHYLRIQLYEKEVYLEILKLQPAMSSQEGEELRIKLIQKELDFLRLLLDKLD